MKYRKLNDASQLSKGIYVEIRKTAKYLNSEKECFHLLRKGKEYLIHNMINNRIAIKDPEKEDSLHIMTLDEFFAAQPYEVIMEG